MGVIMAAQVAPTGEKIDMKQMRWIICHHCKKTLVLQCTFMKQAGAGEQIKACLLHN